MSIPEANESNGQSDGAAMPKRPVSSSLVARSMKLMGNIMSEGDIVIEGAVQGEIRGVNVVIRPDASVDGPVIADRVTIEGYMNGTVTAGHIHLGNSARVNGDLFSENIEIIKGAILLGRINPKQSSSSGLVATQARSRVLLSPPAPALPLLNPPTSATSEVLQLAQPAEMKGHVRSNLQRRLAALAYIR
jgi:cytoskeletal protein CcmA (bactofilin family)